MCEVTSIVIENCCKNGVEILEKFKNEVDMHLRDHILPFWMKLKDEKHGGFFGEVNYDLSINEEAHKGGIAASRFLWSFSAAYRITQKENTLNVLTMHISF